MKSSYRVKVQRIDRINLVALSVALEGEIFLLLCIIKMMNSNPAFYGANLDSNNATDNIINKIHKK